MTFDDQEEGERRELVRLQEGAERPGDVLDGDHVVEHQRAGDQHADRHRDARARRERVVDVAPAGGAIEERGNRERIGRRRCRGFRGRGDSAVEAAEQDHRHHQRGEGLPGEARPFAQRHGRLDREVAPPRGGGDQRHLHRAEQQARDDAAEEEIADRGVRDQRVEHQRDRGRDDRAEHRRDRRQRGGEGRRVLAVAGHQRLHELAGAGGIGERRARHAGEDDALHHVHLGEAAAVAPDERVAPAQQPIHDAAGIHELCGEDEERDREQQVARVHAVQELLGGRPHVEAREIEIQHRARDHRVPDRQAEQAQGDDRQDAERERARGIHRALSCRSRQAATGSGRSARRRKAGRSSTSSQDARAGTKSARPS